MEAKRSPPRPESSRFLGVTAALFAVAIFVVDAFTPLDIAVAVLYVVVVLIAANLLDRQGLVLVSAGCIAATVAAYLLAHGLTVTTAFGRGVMSVAAILITAFLALKNQAVSRGLRAQAQLLDLTHDTIFVRDMKDVVTYWNRGAEDLYGWTREQAVGKAAHELTRTIFPAPLEEITAELLRTGRWEGELVHTRRDGSRVVVDSRWSLQRDERGRPAAIMETDTDITGRKAAEQKLREAERELRRTIDTIPILAWQARPDGFKEYLNQRWLDYTGMAPEDALGWGWQAAVHPDDRVAVGDVWRAIVAAGEPGETEVRLRRFDGEYRWFLFRAAPLRDGRGELVGWYGTNTDIEDRKQAEDALQRSQAYLAEAQRLAATGSWAWDVAAQKAVHWSEEQFRLYGFDPKGQIPSLEQIRERIHPDDRARAVEVLETATREKTPFDWIFRVTLTDGTLQYIHSVGRPIIDGTGQLVRFIGASMDVTERQLAEDRLRRAERELRTTIDTIPALVISAWPDGTWDFINARWIEQGFSEDDMRLGLSGIVHPDDLPDFAVKRSRSLITGEPYQAEVRLRKANGEYRWYLAQAVTLRDEAGQVVKRYALATDIEDRKRAEAALRRSEALLAETQALTHTGSVGYDAATGEVFWSAEGARIFGYDPSIEPTLDLLVQRVHPEDVWLARRSIERTNRGEPDDAFDIRLVMADGVVKHVHAVSHAVRDASARRALRALIDVTAAREAEAALHRAHAELAHVTRVATLGELSASIAHEVNQPLAAIVTNGQACLRWLARDVPDLVEARDAVTRIVSNADRASEVIRRIRELSRKTDPKKAVLDLNEVIDEAILLVRREMQSREVSLELDLARDLPSVRADRVQLQQVLINLMVNGIQAMTPVTDRPRALLIGTRSHQADGVLVEVQDAGIGIAADSESRLFDTFFTTKPDGMGIGLSICRSIIEAHGGQVWARSNDGPGATFQFTLPSVRSNAS